MPHKEAVKAIMPDVIWSRRNIRPIFTSLRCIKVGRDTHPWLFHDTTDRERRLSLQEESVLRLLLRNSFLNLSPTTSCTLSRLALPVLAIVIEVLQKSSADENMDEVLQKSSADENMDESCRPDLSSIVEVFVEHTSQNAFALRMLLNDRGIVARTPALTLVQLLPKILGLYQLDRFGDNWKERVVQDCVTLLFEHAGVQRLWLSVIRNSRERVRILRLVRDDVIANMLQSDNERGDGSIILEILEDEGLKSLLEARHITLADTGHWISIESAESFKRCQQIAHVFAQLYASKALDLALSRDILSIILVLLFWYVIVIHQLAVLERDVTATAWQIIAHAYRVFCAHDCSCTLFYIQGRFGRIQRR